MSGYTPRRVVGRFVPGPTIGQGKVTTFRLGYGPDDDWLWYVDQMLLRNRTTGPFRIPYDRRWT